MLTKSTTAKRCANSQSGQIFHHRGLSLALILAAMIIGCEAAPDAKTIVDKAIEAHGGNRYLNSVIDFDFRGKHFKVERNGGGFVYTRTFTDSTGSVEDVLSNAGISRSVNGEAMELGEDTQRRLAQSVNSVVYFALLPSFLHDPAVQKRYVGEATVAGEVYHKIEVTFQEEQGGEDFTDSFTYWFHKEKSMMDYLAYYYHRDETGTRFRQAFNQRTVSGILFADYHNFKGPDSETSTLNFDKLFEESKLTKVSEIILDNIEVMQATR